MFSRLPVVNERTNSCFWFWRQLRRKLRCPVTTTIMSCRLRRLRAWEVCLMLVETLMTYNGHSRPIEVKGSPVPRVGRRCCARIIEARKAPVLWARRDRHVRIRRPACAVKTAPEKGGGGYTSLHFFVLCAFWPAVHMLVCCVYWLVVSMVWDNCSYRTCQRRVSRISLYYGAKTGRVTCQSSRKQGAERS